MGMGASISCYKGAKGKYKFGKKKPTVSMVDKMVEAKINKHK